MKKKSVFIFIMSLLVLFSLFVILKNDKKIVGAIEEFKEINIVKNYLYFKNLKSRIKENLPVNSTRINDIYLEEITKEKYIKENDIKLISTKEYFDGEIKVEKYFNNFSEDSKYFYLNIQSSVSSWWWKSSRDYVSIQYKFIDKKRILIVCETYTISESYLINTETKKILSAKGDTEMFVDDVLMLDK